MQVSPFPSGAGRTALSSAMTVEVLREGAVRHGQDIFQGTGRGRAGRRCHTFCGRRHGRGGRSHRDQRLQDRGESEPEDRTTCPGADLSSANLAGLNLSFADLAGANLKRANLTGTNFAAADLSHADLSDANITGTNFTDSQRNAVILYSTDIDLFGTIVGDLNITTEPEWSTDAHERALAAVVPVTPQVPLP